MSEIEKMYKNAKVKPVCDGLDCFTCKAKCNNGKYPEFTAEKQLEMIEFYIKSVWWLNLACFKSSSLPFDEELAKLTNHLWEDMTISQQEQIRSILNG